MTIGSSRRSVKRKVYDRVQAKEFMTQAGDEFETEGRRLIKDNYAALFEVTTAIEWFAYIDGLSAALLKGEITIKELNGGLTLARVRAKANLR